MKYAPKICSNGLRHKPNEFREKMFLSGFLYLLNANYSSRRIYLGEETYKRKILHISNKSKVCLRVFGVFLKLWLSDTDFMLLDVCYLYNYG